MVQDEGNDRDILTIRITSVYLLPDEEEELDKVFDNTLDLFFFHGVVPIYLSNRQVIIWISNVLSKFTIIYHQCIRHHVRCNKIDLIFYSISNLQFKNERR